MDVFFNFARPVTGKNFIGRSLDCQVLGNLISQSENVVIYDAPRTGKTSLIQQTLFDLKQSARGVIAIEYNALSARLISDFVLGVGNAVMSKAGSSPEQFASLAEKYLGGTHVIFDPTRYADTGEILSLNWDMDDDDIRAVLRLPYALGSVQGRTLVVIKEFQNVMLTEDGERVLKIMESLFKEFASVPDRKASYLLCGSQVNAMAWIFEHKRFFHRCIERLEMSPVDPKDTIDYVTKHFMSMGKVIDRDLLLGACRLFRNNIWYIMNFASICDSLSRGYVMEPIFNEALDCIINVHSPRFEMMMWDLTAFQVTMLRAIIDGQKKFSSSEVIRQYGLNTSANVKRVKEALAKKEIVRFADDSAEVIDPLFEYWLRKYYFKTEK